MIPIFGPLAFKLSINPSVEIGGEFNAGLHRGKSFGEPMQPGENMLLRGNLKIGGKGILKLAAGLALSSGFASSLANLDLMVGSELTAGINSEATAETSLGLREDKLKQTEDLKLGGSVTVDMTGKVNLSSNLHFLIWNAKLFTVELFKKDISIPMFQGTATRKPNVENIKDGWNFEKMGITAKELGQKTFEEICREKDACKQREEELKISKEAADSIGEEAKEAWLVLEDLNEQTKLTNDRTYVISEAEKTALNARIEKLKEDAISKIKLYRIALDRYLLQLYGKRTETRIKADEARQNHLDCKRREEVRKNIMNDIQRGGFQLEKYLPLSEKERSGLSKSNINDTNKDNNKMAAIDFTIARVLGEYDNAIDKVKNEYEIFVKEEKLKREIAIREGKKPENNYIYKELGSMSNHEFFNYSGGNWKSKITYIRLRNETSFGLCGNNYFDKIDNRYIEYKDADKLLKPCYMIKASDGKIITANVMGVYDYLKILLSGVYPKWCYDKKGNSLEGQKIEKLDAKTKMKIFNDLFDNSLPNKKQEDAYWEKEAYYISYSEWKKTQRQRMLEDINAIFKELFQSDLSTMVEKGNVDMNEKLKKLSRDLEITKKEDLEATEQYQKVQNAMEQVESEQKDCESKLIKLESDVQKGMKLGEDAAGSAKAAVNFVQTEYQDIANGTSLFDCSVKGINKGSTVYTDMEGLSDSVFPDRKKIKASVTG